MHLLPNQNPSQHPTRPKQKTHPISHRLNPPPINQNPHQRRPHQLPPPAPTLKTPHPLRLLQIHQPTLQTPVSLPKSLRGQLQPSAASTLRPLREVLLAAWVLPCLLPGKFKLPGPWALRCEYRGYCEAGQEEYAATARL
jgi:hypothetical protein